MATDFQTLWNRLHGHKCPAISEAGHEPCISGSRITLAAAGHYTKQFAEAVVRSVEEQFDVEIRLQDHKEDKPGSGRDTCFLLLNCTRANLASTSVFLMIHVCGRKPFLGAPRGLWEAPVPSLPLCYCYLLLGRVQPSLQMFLPSSESAALPMALPVLLLFPRLKRRPGYAGIRVEEATHPGPPPYNARKPKRPSGGGARATERCRQQQSALAQLVPLLISLLTQLIGGEQFGVTSKILQSLSALVPTAPAQPSRTRNKPKAIDKPPRPAAVAIFVNDHSPLRLARALLVSGASKEPVMSSFKSSTPSTGGRAATCGPACL